MQRPSPDQRKALGAFLASRRARLPPARLGLPPGRRRTPGLRREEVAVLAGVSVSWYTWLEQGRDVRASAEALQRIAAVLRLDRVESAHVFALSAREPPAPAAGGAASDGLVRLVQAVDPTPAYVRTARFDILAWNPAAAALFVDYGALEPPERNTLRLLFLYPPYRTLILDWAQVARGTLATFRAARARAQDQAPFDRLVDELSGASGEFAAWWREVDVGGLDEGRKRLRHPTLGRVDFTYVALAPEGRPDLSLVAYLLRTPADDPAS